MQLPMAVCTSITGSHWSQLQFLCRLIHRQQTAHYSFLCRLIHRQQTAHYSFFFCRLIHRQQTAHYSFPRRLADRQPRSHCPLFSGLLLCSNRWGYYFNLPAVTRRTNQCFFILLILKIRRRLYRGIKRGQFCWSRTLSLRAALECGYKTERGILLAGGKRLIKDRSRSGQFLQVLKGPPVIKRVLQFLYWFKGAEFLYWFKGAQFFYWFKGDEFLCCCKGAEFFYWWSWISLLV